MICTVLFGERRLIGNYYIGGKLCSYDLFRYLFQDAGL